jgi:hypothetical protein
MTHTWRCNTSIASHYVLFVVEAPENVQQHGDAFDVRQELIAHAQPLTSAFHQPGNVSELHLEQRKNK